MSEKEVKGLPEGIENKEPTDWFEKRRKQMQRAYNGENPYEKDETKETEDEVCS